jgi:GntR family transcriptional regulator, rspAB operon transcriptional repressor
MKRRAPISIRKTPSIREKVYQAIREDILNGRIEPGERLIETQLARQIKTSRTPVREALHTLEREGLLESIPRVGYRVKQLDWDEVEELCEIRCANETLAVLWAIDRITPEGIRELEKNLELSEKVIKDGKPAEFVKLDGEFHGILARASGSERLTELCEMLRRLMLRYRIESIFFPETVRGAVEGHIRLVDCIKRKDKKCAIEAMREHMDYAKRSVQHHAFEERRKKEGVEK